MNKCLFSAALQAICFKYKGMVNYGITILNRSVVVSAFYAKGPRFNPGLGIPFMCILPHAAVAAFIICCI